MTMSEAPDRQNPPLEEQETMFEQENEVELSAAERKANEDFTRLELDARTSRLKAKLKLAQEEIAATKKKLHTANLNESGEDAFKESLYKLRQLEDKYLDLKGKLKVIESYSKFQKFAKRLSADPEIKGKFEISVFWNGAPILLIEMKGEYDSHQEALGLTSEGDETYWDSTYWDSMKDVPFTGSVKDIAPVKKVIKELEKYFLENEEYARKRFETEKFLAGFKFPKGIQVTATELIAEDKLKITLNHQSATQEIMIRRLGDSEENYQYGWGPANVNDKLLFHANGRGKIEFHDGHPSKPNQDAQ